MKIGTFIFVDYVQWCCGCGERNVWRFTPCNCTCWPQIELLPSNVFVSYSLSCRDTDTDTGTDTTRTWIQEYKFFWKIRIRYGVDMTI